MIGEPNSDLTRDPRGLPREITWETGEAELQKSSMALETFEPFKRQRGP